MQQKEPQGSGIVKLAVKPPDDSQMTPSFLHFNQVWSIVFLGVFQINTPTFSNSFCGVCFFRCIWLEFNLYHSLAQTRKLQDIIDELCKG